MVRSIRLVWVAAGGMEGSRVLARAKRMAGTGLLAGTR